MTDRNIPKNILSVFNDREWWLIWVLRPEVKPRIAFGICHHENKKAIHGRIILRGISGETCA
jgi:hypothetical protein